MAWKSDIVIVAGNAPELPVELQALSDLPPIPGVDADELAGIIEDAATEFGLSLLEDLPDLLPEFITTAVSQVQDIADQLEIPGLSAILKVKQAITQINAPRAKQAVPEWRRILDYWYKTPRQRVEEFAFLFAEQASLGHFDEGMDEGKGLRSLELAMGPLIPKVTADTAEHLHKLYADKIRDWFRDGKTELELRDGMPFIHRPVTRAATRAVAPARTVVPGTEQPEAVPVKKARFGRGARFVPSAVPSSERDRGRKPKPKRAKKGKPVATKKKKKKYRVIMVPWKEAQKIELRKSRALRKIHKLFRKGQTARARRAAQLLAKV
jgi:hypothetical protein